MEGGDPSELVEIEMAQLVLPHHANHHGNTFGGQIMEWMAQISLVVCTRQIIAINAVQPKIACRCT